MTNNKQAEKPKDSKKVEPKTAEKKVKVNPKLEKIIDNVSKLSVLELSKLVKALEDKFDVQAVAAAPVAAVGANGAAGDQNGQAAEAKSTFTVVLTEAGSNKIATIKALREVKPDLGLKEAKDMTEQTPADVLTDAKKEDAEEAKKKLETAGAKVELK